METNQPEQVKQSSLKNTKFYKILIWENKLQSALAFLAMMVFFYVHVVWKYSLMNLLIKFLLIKILIGVVKRIMGKKIDASDSDNMELISDEGIKELYVILYVTLNKMVQYLRDIIELKDQRKSFVRTFVFLETSITINLLGDKLSLWLCNSQILNPIVSISLFIIPSYIEKKRAQKLKEGNSSEQVEKKESAFKKKFKDLKAKIFDMIPKYSELEKKEN